MAENPKPTRMELIRARGRIAVASRGLGMLKMKRSGLVAAFMQIAGEVSALRVSLAAEAAKAVESMKLAEIYAGRMTLERIAAEQAPVSAELEVRNVMGVVLKEAEEVRGSAQAGLAYEVISVPTSIDDAKTRYGRLMDHILEIAEKENEMRRLLAEVWKINRRANAIEKVVVPALARNISYISEKIEDRAREEVTSVKFVKGKMQDGQR